MGKRKGYVYEFTVKVQHSERSPAYAQAQILRMGVAGYLRSAPAFHGVTTVAPLMMTVGLKGGPEDLDDEEVEALIKAAEAKLAGHAFGTGESFQTGPSEQSGTRSGRKRVVRVKRRSR